MILVIPSETSIDSNCLFKVNKLEKKIQRSLVVCNGKKLIFLRNSINERKKNDSFKKRKNEKCRRKKKTNTKA